MFMFDNVAGWVDENPPFSDLPFSVTWQIDGKIEGSAIELDSVEAVNWLLDKLAELTDDRN